MKTFAWHEKIFELCIAVGDCTGGSLMINHPFRWLWLTPLTFFAACSFHEAPIAVQPVGPAPLQEFTESEAPNQGYLVVYSKPDPLADDIYGRSRYRLVSADRKLVRPVKNHPDRFGSGPTHVPLPPGKYTVMGEGSHSRNLIVPVFVKTGETTCVYLEDSPSLDAAWARETDVVKLPDGQIVGWALTTKQK